MSLTDTSEDKSASSAGSAVSVSAPVNESRVKKTLLNARVNLIFYFLILAITFFSRKIFLDTLRADFVGLTGTLQNILGYLNLAELGVGAAISFNLYKPIQQGNRELICKIISIFGYYYRNIGLFVLGAGLIVSAFFPLIFKNDGFPLPVIYFAFYSFLTSSLIGYFVNYKQTLLSADQKQYKITVYYQTLNLVKTVLQMAIAYYYSSYYAWIGIELGFGILYSFILNNRINKIYPWFKTSIKLGKESSKDFGNILTSTKQVFVHRIKGFLLTQSDQLFVFAFVSLKMVAYYNNYVLVISKLTSFFSNILDSVGASVGNLVAEGNHNKMMKVFWELMALRYFVAGFICFSIYHLIDPFIAIWLGSEYILGKWIVILLVVNLFISISRGTVDNFNFAYGQYADVWAAWVEGIVNITATLFFAWKWGIAGILLGKTVSIVPIIVFWKPLYLFKDGFHESYAKYWAGTIRYYIVFAVSAFIVHFLVGLLRQGEIDSYLWFCIYGFAYAGSFAVLYFFGMLLFAPGGKNLVNRLPLKKIKSFFKR